MVWSGPTSVVTSQTSKSRWFHKSQFERADPGQNSEEHRQGCHGKLRCIAWRCMWRYYNTLTDPLMNICCRVRLASVRFRGHRLQCLLGIWSRQIAVNFPTFLLLRTSSLWYIFAVNSLGIVWTHAILTIINIDAMLLETSKMSVLCWPTGSIYRMNEQCAACMFTFHHYNGVYTLYHQPLKVFNKVTCCFALDVDGYIYTIYIRPEIFNNVCE